MADLELQDPERAIDAARAQGLIGDKESAFDGKIVTFFEIRNNWGERLYIGTDKKDAEARLVELAAKKNGVGVAPVGVPEVSLSEVRGIEVSTFKPDEIAAVNDRVRDVGKDTSPAASAAA